MTDSSLTCFEKAIIGMMATDCVIDHEKMLIALINDAFPVLRDKIGLPVDATATDLIVWCKENV